MAQPAATAMTFATRNQIQPRRGPGCGSGRRSVSAAGSATSAPLPEGTLPPVLPPAQPKALRLLAAAARRPVQVAEVLTREQAEVLLGASAHLLFLAAQRLD